MWPRGTPALLTGLLFLTSLDSTESLQTAVRPDKGWTVTVSTKPPAAECAVCTVSGVNDTQTSCRSSLSLVPEEEVKLLFKCSQPIEQSYTVAISSSLDCTADACTPQMVEIQPSILTEFPRTFIWELKAPKQTLVRLNILGEGLAETSQPCSDGLQFSVASSPTNIKDGSQYCRGGSVTHLDLLSQAVVSLEVKAKTRVESVLFQAAAGPFKRPTMAVTTDPTSTVVLSRDPGEPECEVCLLGGSSPDCSSAEKTIKSAEKLSVEFSCLKPQDVFSVKVTTKIECTKNSCTPVAAEFDPGLFKDFKKTKIWDISVPDRTVLSLDFPNSKLKDISTTENCQDGYRYTVSTTGPDGTVKTNGYCKGGTKSHLELLGATTVTVEVPKRGEPDQTVFHVTATPRRGRTMSVTSDPNTIITLQRVTAEPDCRVCVDDGSKQTCNPQFLRLDTPYNTSVEFTCPQPQDVFSVEINREIDCTAISCTGDTVHTEATFFPDFNRTFTWDLKVVSSRTFQLDFPEPGMRQIRKEEACPDDHTYTLTTYLRTGPADIGTFCQGGPVNSILVRYKGRVSLQVPGNAQLDPVDFKLSTGPQTTMVAIVKVSLPRGVSETDFITPNYPGKFPDSQQMQWEFTVPGMHNYSLQFQNHTEPVCLKGDVEVEYQKGETKVTRLALTDPQPQQQQGDFIMVLKNCETNTTLQGLGLSYRVSVMRSGHPVLCTVDLTNLQDVFLQIEKVGSDPNCEISMNSQVKEKLSVPGGTTAKLSFLDCPNDDIRLTARQVINCLNGSCPSASLAVPALDSCLPMPLQSFTWLLRVSEDRTLELVSPTGSLHQSLEGQECSQPFLLHVAEADGFSLGDFCFDGTIQRIQAHTNISIMATAQDFSKTRGPFLNVSVIPKISETIIYSVNPATTSPTLLATPNWPLGMKHSSTIAWIVSLPSQYKALLEFVNVSQPKCTEGHTEINVKMLDREEELLSRREDEKMENVMVPRSFYLNMSSCKPQEGHFGVRTKIVLQRKTYLLPILLGLAGALVVLLIVLTAVCIVVKKKKKRAKEPSVYMGKGNIFRPNDQHFIKTRADNNSHIYDYIDDSMVYGHLLGDPTYVDGIQNSAKGVPVESYQTFTGPTDGPLPAIQEPDPEPEVGQYTDFLDPSQSFLPPRPRTPIGRQDSLGFQDRRMMDNELYTFKNTGEINTIRLSGGNQEPKSSISEEDL